MNSRFEIFWTKESLTNLEDILDYLISAWSQREVVNFKSKLSKQLKLISKYPLLFPASQINPNLRKAVLSKQTTVFYKIQDKHIYIIYLFDTRQNPNKIR